MDLGLVFKNVLINVIYYSVTVVVLPAVFLKAGSAVGLAPQPVFALRILGICTGATGLLLQCWCIVLFQRIGGGTPSPTCPTRRLVIQGPYRWVRNPMNLGEVMVFLGLTKWFGSIPLLIYTLAAWIAFHAFIVLCEEPRNVRTFGAPYADYQRAVNRWLPRPPGHRVVARG